MTGLKKLPFAVKLFAAVALAALAGAGALTLALRFYLSPDKVRVLVTEAASMALKREVRVKDVSVSALKGLILEDLEISEAPDFKAGRLAAVDSFHLRVRLLPLLRGTVIVDRISIDGLDLSVSRRADGAYSVDDLTGGGGAKTSAPALPFSLDVKTASLTRGRIRYRDLKTSDSWTLSALTARAKNVSLLKAFPLELSAIVEQAGGPKLSLSFDGEADPAGKAKINALALEAPGCKVRIAGEAEAAGGSAKAAFSRISGTVFGNSLDLSGALKVTPERIELPNLKGKLDDAPMNASLTVRDYGGSPEISLTAKLGSLDAGKLMSGASASSPAKTKPSAGPAMKVKGSLTIAKLAYGDAVANDLTASWDLHGVTPDLKSLGGWAKLRIAGGSFRQSAAPKSGLVRALLLPLTLLKTVGSAIGSLAGLDFSHILFSEIAGDYGFADGLMTLKDFHMNSAAANVLVKGTVDLPGQKLALASTIMLAKVAPIDVDIGGTFDKPTTKLRLIKTLAKPVKKLTQPGLKLLQQIFKPK